MFANLKNICIWLSGRHSNETEQSHNSLWLLFLLRVSVALTCPYCGSSQTSLQWCGSAAAIRCTTTLRSRHSSPPGRHRDLDPERPQCLRRQRCLLSPNKSENRSQVKSFFISVHNNVIIAQFIVQSWHGLNILLLIYYQVTSKDSLLYQR